MPQLECPTCSVPMQETDVVVQCIDCEIKKHASCAKLDPKNVGRRHWRCKDCSRKKGLVRKPLNTVSQERHVDTKREENAAGDSSHHKTNLGPKNLLKPDQGPKETQCSRSVQKLEQLEELVVLLKDKYYEVSKKNDNLEAELMTYKLKVEHLEQRIRKNTVEVWGVPVTEKDNLSSIVSRLFLAVGFKDKESQVESVGKSNKTDADFLAGVRLARVDVSAPRTVIWINFVTNRDKDEFMNRWKALEQNGGLTVRGLGIDKDGQVNVETSLTPYKLQLFQRAVDYANDFKYQRVGVRDGEIFIVKDVSGGPLVFIKSPQDLEILADLDVQRQASEKIQAATDFAEMEKSPGNETLPSDKKICDKPYRAPGRIRRKK